MTQISTEEVANFVATHDHIYGGTLSSVHNYSRVVSLAWLNKVLEEKSLRNQKNVAVVSGSDQELELSIINSLTVQCLNFQEDSKFDLDLDWEKSLSPNFSFTMCNQVLEHVFNPHLAFKNLVHITEPGGFIYITLPVINCIHGEPHFYSSGFHPRYLERMAKHHDLDIIGISSWGSAKYMVHAVSGDWLTFNTLQPGYQTTSDFKFPNFVYSDGRNQNCPFALQMGYKDVMTDCWGFFRKKL